MPSGVYERTAKHRAIMRHAAKNRRRHRHSIEARSKMSLAHMGHEVSNKTRAKISINSRGNRNIRNPLGLFTRVDGRVFVRLVSGWVRRAWVVYVQANGPIPFPGIGKKPDEYCVHHEDEDKSNDLLENLRCWINRKHDGYHMTKRQLELRTG
ncbi:hypothetical protein LCGC14_2108440 [marine sediment metagenome]|uniref:Uncharacterized protein n=1 Tax=marine sediment metagenome TaxID=412755 RepID=A0A0F9EUX3_9ZZZZ